MPEVVSNTLGDFYKIFKYHKVMCFSVNGVLIIILAINKNTCNFRYLMSCPPEPEKYRELHLDLDAVAPLEEIKAERFSVSIQLSIEPRAPCAINVCCDIINKKT